MDNQDVTLCQGSAVALKALVPIVLTDRGERESEREEVRE